MIAGAEERPDRGAFGPARRRVRASRRDTPGKAFVGKSAVARRVGGAGTRPAVVGAKVWICDMGSKA